VYSVDEVAQSCLALQDQCGLDVNLLLYAAWLARRDLRLTAAHLLGAENAVGDWSVAVVQPLRAVRRHLREYPAAASMREQVAALELQAEREQQNRLYRFFEQAPPLPVVASPLRENLVLVAGQRSQAGVWSEILEGLIAQFPP
jgi:uncharacterized protein (TIGR02444 family)